MIRAAHNQAHQQYLSSISTSTTSAVASSSLQPPPLSSSSSADKEIAALYSWDELPASVKQQFYNYWSIFTAIGVLLAVIQGCVALTGMYTNTLQI
jgi:hypothetical protein